MPPRWPRKPTRRDPEFRKLDDRYTYAAHIAVFLCSGSGLVFFQQLYRADWPWLVPLLGWWALGLGIHSFWIFFVARYPVEAGFGELTPGAHENPTAAETDPSRAS
ncbi:hypothetical protein [Synechococcus sp. R55.2]|uniref:hypothetical protein n=1 Tax=Synechococcus sp. R55.2 TaxID=2964496 RepID=UPI0039C068EB